MVIERRDRLGLRPCDWEQGCQTCVQVTETLNFRDGRWDARSFEGGVRMGKASQEYDTYNAQVSNGCAVCVYHGIRPHVLPFCALAANPML